MERIVNVAYYEKRDYTRFLSIIDDRDDMHDSWEEWFLAFMKTIAFLKSQGLFVKAVTVDLDELIKYCTDRKMKNNGATRSQFVMEKR